MKLSICVITMNRATQLKEALESCLSCDLPKETEFVIIDNASNDDTEQTVHATLKDCGYSYYYEKLAENLGAGKGRNYAFAKARGEYIYSLDDDAFICSTCYKTFFTKAIDILNENDNIISLTTQIYDTAWKCNRITSQKIKISDDVYKLSYICEGSNFLRRDFFGTPPYFPNIYGYEALPLLLEIFDTGKYNCFCSSLLAIHNPTVNKWDYSNEKNYWLLIKEVALPYAIKKMMYPRIFLPILFLAYVRRSHKYLNAIPNAKKEAKQIISETLVQYPIDHRIKIRTVIKMFKDFGLSIF